MGVIWLTDKFVQNEPPPESGTSIVYDAFDPKNPKRRWVSGFGVKFAAGGTKAFVLRYRVKSTRQERMFKIGEWPNWSVEAARKEAQDLKVRIDKGEDPLAAIQASRDAPTVSVLCDRFVADHVPSKRASTQENYKAFAKTIKDALGRKLVAAITTEDVEALHKKITERGTPYVANRVLATLSKMMTLAIKWRMRTDNPCKGVERNAERKIKRYLTADELARLTRALVEYPDQGVANVFRLLLFTGARRGEVLSARWEQFDFERNVWTKPAATTKTNTEHELPLGTHALALLKSMRKAAPDDAQYLFPGRGGEHLVEVKKAWAKITKDAGITRLRIHDLRHSHASFLASAGYQLLTIGEMLGHTQVATTARYAHLFDDVKRQAANKVGAKLAGLVAKAPARGKRKPLRLVQGGAR
jgi:integrase